MTDERYRQPGPARVTAAAVVAAAPERVYAALAAWHRQGEWIPLTTVRVLTGDGAPGSTVEAVTGLRSRRGATRIGMRDVMQVTSADPPRELRVMHCAWPLRGPGAFRCEPVPEGTRVEWHEWLHPPAGIIGRAAWPVVRPAVAAAFRIALRRLARLVEAGKLP